MPRGKNPGMCGMDSMLVEPPGNKLLKFVGKEVENREWVVKRTLMLDCIEKHPELSEKYSNRMIASLVSRALLNHGFEPNSKSRRVFIRKDLD